MLFHLKKGINSFTDSYNLEDLINLSITNWIEPEWEIPKGRRNNMEKDITTAIREFQEETGILKHKINIINNILPFDEIFTGSNNKSYRHRYFIAYIEGDVVLSNYQKCEVSNINWFSLENSLKIIRKYNLEKKEVIKNIDKVLKSFRLIF